MTDAEARAKADLVEYLDAARDAVLWKLDGLSEFDLRRPMTPTGTNLLGVLKNLSHVEAGYLGDTFGRPFGEPMPGDSPGDSVHADMFATADESAEDIRALAQRARVHGDATIAALSLDAEGRVPWWPEDRNQVTLHAVLVRLVGEWNRHAGHVDILRELIDGEVGYRPANDNLPPDDEADWPAYVASLQSIADRFR